MTKVKTLFLLAMVICVLGAATIASDHGDKAEKSAEEYGPQGAPEELKQLSSLIGSWNVEQSFKMDPSSEKWDHSKGTAMFMDIYDGCALHYSYESIDAEENFKGTGMIAFNRETQKWQSIWFDNMAASIGLYEGDFTDGKLVVSGEDQWNGMKFISRITTFNITDDRFEWKYEMSTDGGQNFVTTGNAVYTRAK